MLGFFVEVESFIIQSFRKEVGFLKLQVEKEHEPTSGPSGHLHGSDD
jgi:hypothetical protein